MSCLEIINKNFFSVFFLCVLCELYGETSPSFVAINSGGKMVGKEKQKPRAINLNFEKAETKYTNLAILSHSQAEFIIDFARMLPGMEKPEVQDRIIMTPLHAKLLLHALSENIKKYEGRFGNIDIPSGIQEDMGFKA